MSSNNILIRGKVIKGLHIGGKIGYPTINIRPAVLNSPIEFGVYVCQIKIDGNLYRGAVHYGPKSIGTLDMDKIYCEVHVLDFNKDVYNQDVEIKLLKKIRDVRKFNSEKELKMQIAKDIKFTNKYFNAEQT